MTTLLTEASAAPVKENDGVWKAVLITPGKGSSGIYTESMLKEYGPKVFVKGTHSYVDHPAHEGDIRSPKNLMGVLAEDAHYEDGVGLVGRINVFKHWRAFAEEVAPHTGLSIYAMGEGSLNDDGEMVVESLIPDRQASVDMVAYAGRPGSGLAEKLYESAVAFASTDSTNGTAAKTAAATTPNMEEGNSNMDEIKAMLEAMNEAIEAKFAALAETLTPAVENEETEEETVDVAAVAEAMVAAGLPEPSRKAVYSALQNGEDLTEAIEAQKSFVESVKSHLAEGATKAAIVEETVVVETAEAKPSLASILNVKVGA